MPAAHQESLISRSSRGSIYARSSPGVTYLPQLARSRQHYRRLQRPATTATGDHSTRTSDYSAIGGYPAVGDCSLCRRSPPRPSAADHSYRPAAHLPVWIEQRLPFADLSSQCPSATRSSIVLHSVPLLRFPSDSSFNTARVPDSPPSVKWEQVRLRCSAVLLTFRSLIHNLHQ